ncbi:hypothetical protein BOTBODRAFT_56780 [Botryobasidium botryosum FD-172 SS1]|uniref:Uncharacterized protein n=1 Tax=Botryobasidium botryosum (strain FD-172 SS1) TaxID=930990 RepID=A0A067MCS6_BOTB1|nr:hypothetical protein BOTBODRAFT_56780 [Botryobasidium botryosum FD-172 SS1]
MPTPCRERRPWTEEEDTLLRAAVKREDPDSHPPSKWHAIASHVPNRTNKDCRKRWCAKMETVVSKGGWSSEEDERLLKAVEQHGTRWSLVAAAVKTRNSGQCAKRWSDTLNPNIDRSTWTPEEDRQLLEVVKEHGKSWTNIVRTYYPGRTGLSAKNRYGQLTRASSERRRLQPHQRAVPASRSGTRTSSPALSTPTNSGPSAGPSTPSDPSSTAPSTPISPLSPFSPSFSPFSPATPVLSTADTSGASTPMEPATPSPDLFFRDFVALLPPWDTSSAQGPPAEPQWASPGRGDADSIGCTFAQGELAYQDGSSLCGGVDPLAPGAQWDTFWQDSGSMFFDAFMNENAGASLGFDASTSLFGPCQTPDVSSSFDSVMRDNSFDLTFPGSAPLSTNLSRDTSNTPSADSDVGQPLSQSINMRQVDIEALPIESFKAPGVSDGLQLPNPITIGSEVTFNLNPAMDARSHSPNAAPGKPRVTVAVAVCDAQQLNGTINSLVHALSKSLPPGCTENGAPSQSYCVTMKVGSLA